MQMGRFDWSASDGLFKKIVGSADEHQWVTRCNDALASLKRQPALEDKTGESVSQDLGAGPVAKRKGAFSLVEQLAPAAKKSSTTTEGGEEAKNQIFQRRAKECEIGMYTVCA